MFEFGHIFEVGRAIVKGISVDMVWYHVIGGVRYDSVHTQKLDLAVNVDFCTGVVYSAGFFGVPVNETKGVEPFWVTKGNHATLEWYSCDWRIRETRPSLD